MTNIFHNQSTSIWRIIAVLRVGQQGTNPGPHAFLFGTWDHLYFEKKAKIVKIYKKNQFFFGLSNSKNGSDISV